MITARLKPPQHPSTTLSRSLQQLSRTLLYRISHSATEGGPKHWGDDTSTTSTALEEKVDQASRRAATEVPSPRQEEPSRKRPGDDHVDKPPSKRARPSDSNFQDSGRGQPAAQSKKDIFPSVPPRQGIINIPDSDSDAEALYGTTQEATPKIAARQEVIEISDSDDEALHAKSSQEDAQEALAQEDLQSETTQEFSETELKERVAKEIRNAEEAENAKEAEKR
ncbi:hypothetical protein CPLU01_15827 [Colletotrichum plurivorum]|uniref:Uncharacterized protein n=1 Tax=Colletotrichum plurivorum TaxID=2175906 RepID=A0A8H6J631_9PEZI|nr:hypothetical protein CPLU01_15827 [Colletotrichum plurivorum]